MIVRRINSRDVDELFEASCYEFDPVKEVDRGWVLTDSDGLLIATLCYVVENDCMAIKYFKVLRPERNSIMLLERIIAIAKFHSNIMLMVAIVQEYEDAEIKVLRKAGFKYVKTIKRNEFTFYQMELRI